MDTRMLENGEATQDLLVLCRAQRSRRSKGAL